MFQGTARQICNLSGWVRFPLSPQNFIDMVIFMSQTLDLFEKQGLEVRSEKFEQRSIGEVHYLVVDDYKIVKQ